MVTFSTVKEDWRDCGQLLVCLYSWRRMTSLLAFLQVPRVLGDWLVFGPLNTPLPTGSPGCSGWCLPSVPCPCSSRFWHLLHPFLGLHSHLLEILCLLSMALVRALIPSVVLALLWLLRNCLLPLFRAPIQCSLVLISVQQVKRSLSSWIRTNSFGRQPYWFS